ncbi:MAG: cbb3-type cytochrome c oxidase subunit 3 [Gemmatimonadota bacterium]
MTAGTVAYLLFTAALVAVFAGIVRHYYSAKRRDAVEAPKYRMLRDDDGGPERDRRNAR